MFKETVADCTVYGGAGIHSKYIYFAIQSVYNYISIILQLRCYIFKNNYTDWAKSSHTEYSIKYGIICTPNFGPLCINMLEIRNP